MPEHRCTQNADHFAHNSPFSAFFTKVVCVLGAAPPQFAASLPSIGGNCTIRGTTRRRHAVAVRLMVQTTRWAAGRGRRAGGELLVGGPSRHGSPVVHTVTRCSAGKPPDMHAGGGAHARNSGFAGGSGPRRPQRRQCPAASDGEHDLRGAALVHGGVALGGLLNG